MRVAASCDDKLSRRTSLLRDASSYHEVITRYIIDYREAAASELAFFRTRKTFPAAIEWAALARLPDGTRHPHQRRRSRRTLKAANLKLQSATARLRRCTSFDYLHRVVKERIGNIRGVGPLTVYDIATRIGGHLGLEPELVYLHAGTTEGARALGVDTGRDGSG